MIEIKIQVHHETYLSITELANLFRVVIEGRADIEVSFTLEEITSWIEKEGSYILPNHQNISSFWLRFDEFANTKILEELINDPSSGYLKAIEDYNNHNKIFKVLRLQDSLGLDKSLQYHKEVASFEMQLREIINFILHYDNRTDFSTLKSDFNIEPFDSFELKSANEYFENQLFHLSFKQYLSLYPPKVFSKDEKIDLLTNANDFEEFKDSLESRKIKTDRHIAFISSIKDKMDSVEKLRNAVMHNRAITKKTESQYLKIKADLEKIIKEFWEVEKEEQITLLQRPEYQDLWKNKAREKVEEILENIYWTISGETNGVVEGFAEINEEEYCKQFYNTEDLQIALELIAEEEAELYMPTDEEVKEQLKELFDSEKMVLECLEPYREQIEGLGWELE